MAWNVTRKATQAELAAVDEAAGRFCKRHGLDTSHGVLFAIDCATNPSPGGPIQDIDQGRKLRYAWRATLRRITGSPDGIAYGTVGTSE